MNFKRLILTVLCNIMFVCTSYGVKRALIIGIGNYSYAKTGWREIASSNDVRYVKHTLAQHGFMEDHVQVKKDLNKQQITDALQSLLAVVNKGDIVVIHISSHGIQLFDVSGDELDGLDECIVPIDAIAPARIHEDMLSYELERSKYYTDDEFSEVIQGLRLKLGHSGDLIISVDACFSGTLSKGRAGSRGGQPPLMPKNFNDNINRQKDDGIFDEYHQVKTKGNTDFSSYVIFSAADAYTPNNECSGCDNGNDLGSLTYAFCHALQKLEKSSTYRTLFSIIKTKMAAVSNIPAMEGDGIDRQVFGGAFVHQKPYLEVSNFVNEKQVRLKSGLMAGLDIGARVTLYPPNTVNPRLGVAIDSGTIINADGFSCILELDHGIPASKQHNLPFAFLTKSVYNIPVRVCLNDTRSKDGKEFSSLEREKIGAQLKQMPMIKISPFENADLRLAKGATVDSLLIVNNGLLFRTVDVSDPVDLKAALNAYQQYQFLCRIDLADQDINVSVKLVPTGYTMGSGVDIDKGFSFGNRFVLEIENKSDTDVYVNILDLQPDGVINPVLPNSRPQTGLPIYPADLRVTKNSKRLLSEYPITVGPPAGLELFKVFVSLEMIDLEAVVQAQGAKFKGDEEATDIEKLINKSYLHESANARHNNSYPGTATYDIYFMIKE